MASPAVHGLGATRRQGPSMYLLVGGIQAITSTAPGHTPKGGTIPVDTAGMRKEAGAAFQVEWTKPQTPRATPPPRTHTTTIFFGCPLAKSYGRPQLV